MLTFSRDRIASLKAAAVGAIALCMSRLLLEWMWPQGDLGGEGLDLGLDLGLGTALCGGVFGLTYRYTLRQERDIHLTTGAIAAFGITRAAGQWEGLRAWADLDGIWGRIWDSLGAGEWGAIMPIGVLMSRLMIVNAVPFAIAALVLDGVFAQGWVDRCAGDRRADPPVEG
jgi:hypothetical protein